MEGKKMTATEDANALITVSFTVEEIDLTLASFAWAENDSIPLDLRWRLCNAEADAPLALTEGERDYIHAALTAADSLAYMSSSETANALTIHMNDIINKLYQ